MEQIRKKSTTSYTLTTDQDYRLTAEPIVSETGAGK